MTRPSASKETACVWCGRGSNRETAFNGHKRIPICGGCLDRLDEARAGRDHGYVLRWFERHYPPPATRRPDPPATQVSSPPAEDCRETPAPSRFSLKGNSLAGVRAESARARREVAAGLAALDAEARDRLTEVPDVGGLEAEIKAAVEAGNRQRAEQATAAFRRHWLAIFEEARSS